MSLRRNSISRGSSKSKTSGIGSIIIKHNSYKQRRQEKLDKNKNIKKQAILYFTSTWQWRGYDYIKDVHVRVSVWIKHEYFQSN